MKNITIYFLLVIAFTFSAFSQKVSRETVKKVVIEYPTLPIENVKKVGIKVYYPHPAITQDTISKYAGNLDIMKSDAERLSRMKEFPYREIKMVDKDWDLLVEVSFSMPRVLSKKLNRNFSYTVEHVMKTIVKITNSQGEILDVWTESPRNTVGFGNEQIESVEAKNAGYKATVRTMNFDSEAALIEEYEKSAEVLMYRKPIFIQLKKIIEKLYDKIYFNEVKDKFTIGTGKGKNYDYTELETAQTNAVTAIEENSFDKLDASIIVWEKYLKESDLLDKKAMISKKVTAILYGNLTIAYLYKKDFPKAEQYVGEYLNINKSSQFRDYKQAEKLKTLIELRKLSDEINGHLKVPVTQPDAFDFKKEIAKRKRIKNYKIYLNEDKYKEFKSAHDDFLAMNTLANDEASKTETGESTGENKYLGRVMDTPTQDPMLMLNPMYDKDIIGKEFPVEITDIVELGSIVAPNMKFTSIPESIGNMTKLNKLVLSGSDFTELPESIGNCVELKKLNLSKTKITTVPESIKNCVNLKTLNLKGTKISASEVEKIKAWLPKKCKVKI